jgi:hypothetical protein
VFLGNWQVVGLKGFHVSVDGFPDIRERGFLRFPLAYATGQAGALGHPEPVFPTIDQHLAHVHIVHDFAEEGAAPRVLRPGPGRPESLSVAVPNFLDCNAGCCGWVLGNENCLWAGAFNERAVPSSVLWL